jgi:type IV pilus assembly protein PilB
MDTARVKLGQLLVDAGILAAYQLEAALERQRTDGRRLGTLLVEGGLVTETQVTQVLSQQLSIPWVSLYHIEFTRQLLNLVPRALAERHGLVPIYVRHVRELGRTLYVAMDDPTDEEALVAVSAAAGLPVRPMIAPPTDIRGAIAAYYEPARGGGPSVALEDDVAPPDAVTVPRMQAAAPWRDEAPTSRETGRARAASSAPPPAASPAPPDVAPSAAADDVEIDEDAIAGEVVAAHEPAAPEQPRSVEEPAVVEASPTPPPVGTSDPRRPRMVMLTMMDGTTITLPAPRPRQKSAPIIEPVPASEHDAPPPSSSELDQQLTARDLVAALRAVSHGANASEILGDAGWEKMFAALLSLMLRKQLIADWEFIAELKKI